MKSFNQFLNEEDIKLDLPTVSVIMEGGMSKDDLFKRKNKSGFIEKGSNGELLDVKGNKLSIKDQEAWDATVHALEVAISDGDLDKEWLVNVKKALGVGGLGTIDKIANGFSTVSGKDPSGEDWEAGIAVALDKLQGRNFMETPEWERFGKYWGDWEDQAMLTAKDFITKLKVTQLAQTGAMKVGGLTPEWKGSNTTPKTDLMDKGGRKRISLKKSGGSQLMSAGKEESISTVEAAMRMYSANPQGQKKIDSLLNSLENKMIKLSEKGQVSDIEALRGKDSLSPQDQAKLNELDLGQEYAKELTSEMENLFNSEPLMKSYFCWEAATGHGKFGQDTWPTATVIATFKGSGGIESIQELKSPEKDGGAIAKGNGFYVSFKSSGSSAPYLSLRSKKVKLNNSHTPYTLGEILVEEIMKEKFMLTEDLQTLNEFQLVDKILKTAKDVSSKVSSVAKRIWAAVLQRINEAFNWIKKQGRKILDAVLYFFGLKINDVKLKSGGTYPLFSGLKTSAFAG